MNPKTVLWIYIVFLMIGGLIGFFKGKSKISLIMSGVSAAILVLTAVRGLFDPAFARGLANVVMAALFGVALGALFYLAFSDRGRRLLHRMVHRFAPARLNHQTARARFHCGGDSPLQRWRFAPSPPTCHQVK